MEKKKKLFKILGILGALFILLLVLLFSLPVLFKDDILAKVKETANNNLNAQVDFGDVDLSLFKNFPDFTFTIQNVSIAGVDEFKGTSLFEINSMVATVDLMSVIGGGAISIKTIDLDTPVISARVLENGKVIIHSQEMHREHIASIIVIFGPFI